MEQLSLILCAVYVILLLAHLSLPFLCSFLPDIV